jgi:hypothetical protein
MFDPVTIVYVMLGAAGLVGADAYMNSSTLFLRANVAPTYEDRGFSSEVVEAILLGKLDAITSTKSLVMSRDIVSSNSPTVSGSLAEVAGITDALESIKTAAGLDSPVLLANIVVDKLNDVEVPRMIVAGQNERGKDFEFSLTLNDEKPFDEVLSEVAERAMNEISPYLTALHAFDDAEQEEVFPTKAEGLVTKWLSVASAKEYDAERALFENLYGLIHLLKNDVAESERWFLKSSRSDPDLKLAKLNLAYIAAYQGEYEKAIAIASPIADGGSLLESEDDNIKYVALNLTALSYSQLDDFEKSEEYFVRAADLMPEGVSVYYYWSNSYRRQGMHDEMKMLMETAERNSAQMVNYPELAGLYVWLPLVPGQQLSQRSRAKITDYER